MFGLLRDSVGDMRTIYYFGLIFVREFMIDLIFVILACSCLTASFLKTMLLSTA